MDFIRLGFTALLAAGLSTVAVPAARACENWQIGGVWTVQQSNGFTVTLTIYHGKNGGVTALGDPNFHGTAEILVGFGQPLTGSLDGAVKGNKVEFNVYWPVQMEAIGEYEGTINDRGRMEGRTQDRLHGNSIANWYTTNLGGQCIDGLVTPPPKGGVLGNLPPIPKSKPDIKDGLQSPGKFFQH